MSASLALIVRALIVRHARTLGLAGAIVAACLAPASAQQQTKSSMKGLELSNDQPIQIESDKLQIKEQESKAIFTGNVKVVQGTTLLQSGAMVVYYKSGGGQGSVTSGNADIDKIDVSERVFLQSGTQQATADTGTFNMASQTLVLKGKRVILSEGPNVFEGCQLDVNMTSGEAVLSSCGGRVQIMLDPKSKPAN
ncbi:LptA/OstA family protein [Pararhizobium sp.]|uniref:LptA/OstA family protein n=1 Tax=Pararhizobium sp. TaxID=1977563 RepID=UPI0027231496|nr:LptA/OstA family protein [Pararhizobium sp.]MDO9417716.1 LptA/OstA family protein [Pararhizobium sp.]